LNGSVQVDNDGRATILLPIARDRDLEGDETLTLTLQGTSVSVLVKDTSTPTTPLFNEVTIAKILDAYSLQEKQVEVQTQDSALVQVLKFDGKWTTGFRADVQEFIDWHRDSTSGDKALGALNVDFTLSFIEQALVGLDRLNWINIVGLLADFKVTNGAYAFDGDFGG
jgi:hypothetical protein